MRRVLSAADLDEFRDRVCAAAAELVAELGYDGFNMRVLAARLGVSAMTAYRYFDSKADILAAMRARGFDALARRIETAAEAAPSTPERFVAACSAHVAFAREEPIRYRLMFDLSQPQTARPAELVRAEASAYEALARHARAFARMELECAGLERFAQLVWGALHGIVALTLMNTYQGSELDDLVRESICRLARSCGCRLDADVAPTARKRFTVRAEPMNGALRQAVAIPLTLAE